MKNRIFWLVIRVSACDYTVFIYSCKSSNLQIEILISWIHMDFFPPKNQRNFYEDRILMNSTDLKQSCFFNCNDNLKIFLMLFFGYHSKRLFVRDSFLYSPCSKYVYLILGGAIFLNSQHTQASGLLSLSILGLLDSAKKTRDI